MKIELPKAELWLQGDTENDKYSHVARCGHISYMADSKGIDSDKKFYQRLIDNNHLSVLRHESYYFIIPATALPVICLGAFVNNPYIHHSIVKGNYAISTNGNYIQDNKWFLKEFGQYQVTPSEFKKVCPELMRYTFCLTTQISTTRELNRVSGDFGITEMSTRYIRLGGKVEPSIVRPYWFRYNDTLEEITYTKACENAFNAYNSLLEYMKPQDTRGVLPLDTMTKVVYTAPVSVWRHIIDLRYFGTTGPAHPNCIEIIGQVKTLLEEQGYTFNPEV